MSSDSAVRSSKWGIALILTFAAATILAARLAAHVMREVFFPSGPFDTDVSYLLILGVIVTTACAAYLASRKIKLTHQTWNAFALMATAVGIIFGFIALGRMATLNFAFAAPFVLEAFTYLISAAIAWLFVDGKIARLFGTTAAHLRSTAVATALAFVASITLIATAYAGIPGERQRIQEDMRRIDALSSIERAAYEEAQIQGEFPLLIVETGLIPDLELLGTNPYQRIDKTTIRLCAVFKTKLEPNTAYEFASAVSAAGSTELVDVVASRIIARWSHEEGIHCFERSL